MRRFFLPAVFAAALLGIRISVAADSSEPRLDFGADIRVEDYSPDDISAGRSAALAAFSGYMLARTPEERLDKLLATIEADPFAAMPVGCFVRELESVKDHSSYREAFIRLAERHPAALRLSVVAAYFLSQEKRQVRLIELVDATLGRLNLGTSDDKEIAAAVNLVALAVRAYITTERFEDGDRLMRRYLRRNKLSGNVRFLTQALIFYQMARDNGKDVAGFWWFSESSGKRYRRLFREVLEMIDALCEKGIAEPADIIPVLDICRRTDEIAIGEAMLLRLFKASPEDIRLLIFLAVYYDNCDMNEESFRIWREVVRRDPMQPRFSLELAKVAEQTGRFGIAAAAYRNYLAGGADDPVIRCRLGAACIRNGDYLEALDGCAPVQEHPPASYIMAMALRRLGRHDEALEMMRQCERLAKESNFTAMLDDMFYRTLAFMYERAGRVDEAVAILREQYRKTPDDPILANALGYVLADNNLELEESFRLLQSALEKEPDNPAIIDSMAWVLFRQGKFEEAAVVIERALTLSGSVPEAVIADHAGDIYHARRDYRRALKYWRLAERIYCPEGELDREKLSKKIAELIERHPEAQD